jgi:hypothetical protein
MPQPIDLRELLRPHIVDRGIRATARSAGIDHSSLVAWMKGRREISATTLQELINVLGIRITVHQTQQAQEE